MLLSISETKGGLNPIFLKTMTKASDKLSMKKKIIIPFVLMLFSEAFIFAHEGFGFDWSVLTGFPIYGQSETKDAFDDVTKESANRVIVGSYIDVSYGLNEILGLYLGGQLRSDFLWNGSSNVTQLDYSFFGGIQICPWNFGVIFSVAYAPGSCTQFVKTKEDKYNHQCAWGNGFRLGIEYDILHTFDVVVSPTVGVLYEFFPRGDNVYDNIFSFYIGMKF